MNDNLTFIISESLDLSETDKQQIPPDDWKRLICFNDVKRKYEELLENN